MALLITKISNFCQNFKFLRIFHFRSQDEWLDQRKEKVKELMKKALYGNEESSGRLSRSVREKWREKVKNKKFRALKEI